uniref:Uncharacterized protein n=1 Tax=Zea mays TaxID=4577 RepID=C0PAN5_MAIZE|nr:unknown [Zea mays]
MEETCRWCGVRVQGGGGAGLGHAGAAQLRAADQSRVLGVEVDDLLEVEVQDLGDGAGVAGEPEDVLEEDGVDVHEDGAGAAPGPALLPARRRLQEQPERVGVEHEAIQVWWPAKSAWPGRPEPLRKDCVMETRKNHSVSVTSSSTASSGAGAGAAEAPPEMRELSSRSTRLRCSCSACAAGVSGGRCLRLSSSQPL